MLQYVRYRFADKELNEWTVDFEIKYRTIKQRSVYQTTQHKRLLIGDVFVNGKRVTRTVAEFFIELVGRHRIHDRAKEMMMHKDMKQALEPCYEQ